MSELLKNLYEKSKSAASAVDRAVSDTKRKFTDALVDATNLMPADMRKGQAYEQGQQDIKTVTGNLFDIATPDATAAVGKLTKLGKLGKMMAKPDVISDIVGAASKANSAYGKVTVKDNQPKQTGYGKVTVINPEPKQTGFGKVIMKDSAQKPGIGKITVVDTEPKQLGKVIFKPY